MRILVAAFALAGCATTAPPPTPAPTPTPTPPPPPPPPIARVDPIIEPPPPVEPPPPPPPRHYKLLIVGDSMAATDFGTALEKELEAHRYVTCRRRGKSATGLARPDFFDWMKEGAKLVKKHQPDVVLVVIGGNDGQDLIAPKGAPSERIFWKTDRWKDAYRDRVMRFLELLSADDRIVLWLELPLMDHRSLEEKLEQVRAVQKDAVASVARASWIETRRYFVDDRGKLMKQTKIEGWRAPQAIRQNDGIHFTVPGAAFFAQRVYPEVLSKLGL
jgi:uncharacterized protein